MLGTLTRRLRLMGYDTLSANTLFPGSRREDTVLLEIAVTQGRILLTRDAELARRAGEQGVRIRSERVEEQVAQLLALDLVRPALSFDRCSLCNTPLRPARRREIEGAEYAPRNRDGLSFFWCPVCHRLYWMGSHTRRMREEMEKSGG
ncbi:hypothetical protein E2N92_03820 [Methanofollis formosanus]|uniref:Mut7-C RNAse domain-containing protein n=2 Tax=Methanofollis formosanus TaxID=299308 RepID=A0A8G1A2Y7_9EURY|nr:hypothetical protein E2N92_03820 [Methanofollis formosanus]